uniref:GNAT family N-acetyltransferase n=1 Tax=Pedobacter schmidteae TaxID=2201271 RepID=UPI000EB46DB1|nr:GNAT family N-acetyltransferase [Pedobacter schmidteae]
MFTFEVQKDFTPELNQLRRESFPGTLDLQTAVDEFDQDSQHGVLYNGDRNILAYCRFTPNPGGVFSSWARRVDLLPNTVDCVDLGRCLVNPEFRGQGLMEVLVLHSLLYAKKKNFLFVNGGVTPNRGMNEMIYDLGFEDCGAPVPFHQSNGKSGLIQLVTCDITLHGRKWESRLESIMENSFYRLEKKH